MKYGKVSQSWKVNAMMCHPDLPQHHWVVLSLVPACIDGIDTPDIWPNPTMGPPDVNSRLKGKDPESAKAWGQEEEGATEDEMVGGHHWLRDMSLSKLWERVKGRGAWRAAVYGVTKSQTQATERTWWVLGLWGESYQSRTSGSSETIPSPGWDSKSISIFHFEKMADVNATLKNLKD